MSLFEEQVVWGISLTIAAPVMLTSRVPASHVEALLGAAAIGAVFALLFMIKGLLIFDPHPGPRADGRDSTSGELATPLWNMAMVRHCSLQTPAMDSVLLNMAMKRHCSLQTTALDSIWSNVAMMSLFQQDISL